MELRLECNLETQFPKLQVLRRAEDRERSVAAIEGAQAARQEAMERAHSQCIDDAQSAVIRLQVIGQAQALSLILPLTRAPSLRQLGSATAASNDIGHKRLF